MSAFFDTLSPLPAAQGEWVQFASILGTGLLAALVLRQLARRWVQKMLVSPRLVPAEAALGLLSWPLPALVIAYALRVALDSFKGLPPALWTLKQQVLTALLTALILIVGWRAIDLVLCAVLRRFLSEDDHLQDNLLTLLVRSIKLLFAALILLLILQNHGVQILPLITGLGFLGAAVALAAQSTIGNAIGGVEILADRLFSVGHRVQFGEYDGFVVHRGLRSVSIKAVTGEVINVPNKDLVDKQVRNHTREVVRGGKKLRIHRLKLDVGLVYACTPEQVRQGLGILRDIAEKDDRVHDHATVFRSFGESSLNLELLVWADYQDEHRLNEILTDLNLQIKERFDAAGLGFAFPTRTLHIEGAVKTST